MASGNLVQSLERGLDILERVAGAGADGMGVGAVAAALSLKPPTVHNLMRTLTARGYLRREAKPVRYRLGPALGDICHRSVVPSIPASAEQELLVLQRAHPEGVFILATASARSVTVVLRVSPESPGVIQHPVAHSLSAYGSSSALLFQALWPDEMRSAFSHLHPFWDSAAPSLWKTPEALAAFLENIRRMGVAVTRFHGETGVKVSVPVQDREGTLVAALGGSVPTAGLTAAGRKNLVAELKAAATRLSQESPR
jgi:IclR family acetate operon transcriptional repressor